MTQLETYREALEKIANMDGKKPLTMKKIASEALASGSNQFTQQGEQIVYVFTEERPAKDYNEWQDEERIFVYDEVSDDWLKKVKLSSLIK